MNEQVRGTFVAGFYVPLTLALSQREREQPYRLSLWERPRGTSG
jgi:hypothetical protein